jgi:large subunit ribosomal protein L21
VREPLDKRGLSRIIKPLAEPTVRGGRAMYSIVETGGKQYRVAVGDLIDVEVLDAAPGSTVSFDRVLMVVGPEQTMVGRPTLPQVKVTGEVLGEEKGPKLTVFRFKRRKGIRKKTGHRQHYTRVKISGITVG